MNLLRSITLCIMPVFVFVSCKKNSPSADSAYVVSTIPGGFIGPTGVAVDNSGNIYVADQGYDRIAVVDPTGTVKTFAGGLDGSMDGPGDQAGFSAPSGVALGKNDTVYVADYGNSLIRKITPSAVVSTVAGMLNVPILNDPYSLVIDRNDNLFVAQQGGNNIIKIDPAGNISVFAGSGSPGSSDGNGSAASFNQPTGIALDANGNFYVADSYNNMIRKISATGKVTTLAGSGIAGAADSTGSSATFNSPMGVAVDAASNVYVADGANNKIRMITPAGKVSTIAGTGISDHIDGPGNMAAFAYPSGIALDTKGNIYVADLDNDKVRKITRQ